MSHTEYLNQMAYDKENNKRGHSLNFYHFKIFDTENKTYHYFKECNQITTDIGIKKGSLYNMLKNHNNTCPKWKRYRAYSIRQPVYSRIPIMYHEEPVEII
jgi:hypothetical protein